MYNINDYGEHYRELMAGIYTPQELGMIKQARVSVAGVGGGIGSYLLDLLVRKGFEKLKLADPELYEPRNLNRQLFAFPETLGKPKLALALEHALRINPDLEYDTYEKVDVNTAEDFVSDATVLAFQAEGLSAWVLSQYMCSKYGVPFVNSARKGISRTTLASKIFNYAVTGDVFDINQFDFASWGMSKDLSEKMVEMFKTGKLDQDVLDEADRLHKEFRLKKKFREVHQQHSQVGPIYDRFPNDYFKRYSDPELCLVCAVLTDRAVTDLVIGRNTEPREFRIFPHLE